MAADRRTACSTTSAPAPIRRAAACRPRRSCRSSSASTATPCAARWRSCRAAGWCASSRAAARSSPRTCWNTRSRRARGSPNGSAGTTRSRPGRVLQLQGDRGRSRRSRRAWASGPAAAWCCWSGWALPMTGRWACRSTISPPRGCAACWRRCEPRPRITEALKAVGVTDYLRQTHPRHRAAAERGGGGAAAHAAQPAVAGDREHQCRPRRRGGGIRPSARYPTPRVQIVFEP